MPKISQSLKDKLRMLQFLLLAITLYGIAMALAWTHAGDPSPVAYAGIETAFWKLGNVTIAAYIGYWIDRILFKSERMNSAALPILGMRRATIVVGAMLGVALGL